MEMILIAVLILLLGLTAWHERRNKRWWAIDLAVGSDVTMIARIRRLATNEIVGAYGISVAEMFHSDSAGNMPAAMNLARKINWQDYDIDGSWSPPKP